MNRHFPLMLLALFACKGKDDESTTDDSTPVGDDSQVQTDDSADDSAEPCMTRPSELSPEEEETGWFYRKPLTVRFTEAAPDATFRLYDRDTQTEQGVTVTWNDSNEIATLEADSFLWPSTPYGLDITVCDATYTTTFDTSAYGEPLTLTPEELVDRTYVIEFGDVEFTEPEGFGALLALYVDVPILVGVETADSTQISLTGAQGYIDSNGDYLQRRRSGGLWVPTWPFNGVDFSTAPFFSAEADSITIAYNGVDIPVYDFHLDGTFAADGSTIGGAQLWGLGDTRNMGIFFDDPDNASYVCDLVTSVGATCEACPNDGEVYCLFIRGEDITADFVPDLSVEAIDENGPIP